jgi:hypothetical protein
MQSMFGAKVVTAMVLIGVILFIIGGAMATMAPDTEPVDPTEPDDVRDATQQAYNNYKRGATLMVLGNSILILFLVGGSLQATDVSPYVRLGLLIFCGMMMFATIFLVVSTPATMLQTGPTIWK